jgi:hypothetical protein
MRLPRTFLLGAALAGAALVLTLLLGFAFALGETVGEEQRQRSEAAHGQGDCVALPGPAQAATFRGRLTRTAAAIRAHPIQSY